MRRLIMWNMVTLDGYFEGLKPWDIGWHEIGWGEELSGWESSRRDPQGRYCLDASRTVGWRHTGRPQKEKLPTS
jgi:hypothetical protein